VGNNIHEKELKSRPICRAIGAGKRKTEKCRKNI
jgi:hypothetical protein